MSGRDDHSSTSCRGDLAHHFPVIGGVGVANRVETTTQPRGPSRPSYQGAAIEEASGLRMAHGAGGPVPGLRQDDTDDDDDNDDDNDDDAAAHPPCSQPREGRQAGDGTRASYRTREKQRGRRHAIGAMRRRAAAIDR